MENMIDFIDTINKIKNEFDNVECNMIRHRNENNIHHELTKEERNKICKNCILYNNNITFYDNEDNKIEVDICIFLDTLEEVEIIF